MSPKSPLQSKIKRDRNRCAQVVLPLPLSEPYTYSIPDELETRITPGCRVEVPLGNRYLMGIVVDFVDDCDMEGLRPIVAAPDEEPLLPKEALALLAWITDYYFAMPGEAIRAALPPGLLAVEKFVVRLSPRGRALLAGLPDAESSSMDGKERSRLLRILSALPATGEMALGAFQKASRLSRRQARTLETDGWIETTGKASAIAREKTMQKVRAAVDAETAATALSRAPKQARLFAELSERGPTFRSELTRDSAAATRALSELIKRGLVAVAHERVLRSPASDYRTGEAPAKPYRPRKDQAAAIGAVVDAFDSDRHQTFLLNGPPGSGKTEVYLQAAAPVLAAGRSVLLLVPEIALTPQLFSRVAARFSDGVALWHSGLSAGERHDEWRRIRNGEARLIVGARSAVLTPIADLGLIVVDEEQDPSYKSDERVLFQARDVAIWRGAKLGIPVLLGSATPSVESIAKAKGDAYTELVLARPEGRKPPVITLVDILKARRSKRSLLSPELMMEIKGRLAQGEQTILFLNRRGFAPFLTCHRCRTVLECRYCSIPLAYHRTTGRMVCHACGYRIGFPELCLSCGSDDLQLSGVGTQRVEDELELSFPEARIARLDRDATARKGALADILSRFDAGEIDILIGTQMVTKGHDFPNVTLVGVLSADRSLHVPDFRASERTFQMLTQVAGRAGRDKKPGDVIIQTFDPEHPALQAVRDYAAEPFYDAELQDRRGLYPPYTRLAMIRVEGEDERRCWQTVQKLGERLRKLAGAKPHAGRISVLGPTPAPVFVLRGRRRFRILLRAPSVRARTPFLQAAREAGFFRAPSGVRVILDIDPGEFA